MTALVAVWQILSPLNLQAATIIKLDNNDDFSLTTSWTGGVVPLAADIASFNNTLTGATNFALGGNQSLLGIQLTNPSGAITITGATDTLTLLGSGIDMSTATQDMNLSMRDVVLLANQTWNVNAGRTLNVSGELLGSSALTLSGGATGVTILGGNSFFFTGTTTVNSGATLVATQSNSLGSTAATTVNSGGSLVIDATSANIMNAETLNLSGTGVLNNGALRLFAGRADLAGGITLGAATEIQAESGSFLALTGAVGGATFNTTFETVGTGVIRATGVIGTTTGTVTKEGAGTLILTGANTFTGATNLNAGTLRVGNAAALGTGGTGNLIIAGGTTLAMADGIARTLANNITVNGNFTLGEATVGTGAMTLSGTVNLGGATRDITVALGTNGIANRTLSGVISNGGINKLGNGTLVLSGASTYTGGTTLGAGTLLLGAAS